MPLVPERMRVDLRRERHPALRHALGAAGFHRVHRRVVDVARGDPRPGGASYRFLQRIGVGQQVLQSRGSVRLAVAEHVGHLLPVGVEAEARQPEVDVQQIAALDQHLLGSDSEEPSRELPRAALALHAHVGLEPGPVAQLGQAIVEKASHLADRGPARHDHLVGKRAPGQLFRRRAKLRIRFALLGKPGIEILLDERPRRDEARLHPWPQGVGEEFVGGFRQAARDAAARPVVLWLDRQSDGARIVSRDYRLDALLHLAELLRRLEEAHEVVLGVSGDGVPLEAPGARVGEDEEVAPTRVRPRRSDVLRDGVVVEFLVHHDPHRDPVPPHHLQEEGVALLEPAFAHRDLARER